MAEANELYKQSSLSFASYANLFPGISGDLYINALKGSGMVDSQAADFAAHWIVIDQYRDASGVSATVFEEVGTGKRYLSVRGTESVGDINADYILALGFPSYLNPQFIRLHAQVETWLNDGTLSNGFAVTGHSLGGYLAAAISTSFRSQAGETYMYNAPGVGGLAGNVLDAFRAAFGFDGTALVSGITNVRGTAGFSAIAGLGVQLAPPIFVETESNPNPFANHSIIGLSDALSIYDLFARLSPTASLDTVTNILKAASYTRNTASTTDKSLESALDAIRNFIADYQQGVSTTGVTSTIPNDRDDFYKNLLSLQSDIKGLSFYNPDTQSLGLTVTSLADAHANGLVAGAKFSAATRYALLKLNPFLVTGNNAVYDQINTDGALTLYDPTTGTGSLSDRYLKDRAAFLANKIFSGVGDKSAQSGDPLAIRNGSPLYFEDRGRTTTYGLYQGENNAVSEIPFEEISQIIFGHADIDLIGGSDQGDHLYGMAGNDTLQGNKGNDYLEGGQGTDTYTYASGDGLDTILDTDGLGKIQFDGTILNGGNLLIGETYQSADRNYFYTLLHNTGEQDSLLINAKGGTILIKDFQSGELDMAPALMQNIHRNLHSIHLAV